jgi:uncharacterized membrane-anchored protein
MITIRRTALVLLLAAASSAGALAQGNADNDAAAIQARETLKNLNWIRGPQTVTVFDVASITVPPGYVFLNPEDTQKFNTLSQNPSSGTEYLLAPEDLRWASFLSFRPDGYVKDDERIDAASILDSIKRGTRASNKERRKRGWPEMTIIGWKRPPSYDSQTKRLEWAINAATDHSSVINFNTRILGRRGVTSVVLVVDPERLDTAVGEFKASLGTYTYSSSERYAAFRPGDRIAQYGLGALVTGGIAAAAVKTGFWKSIGVFLAAGWKLVAAALAGFFAYVRNLFKRRQTA